MNRQLPILSSDPLQDEIPARAPATVICPSRRPPLCDEIIDRPATAEWQWEHRQRPMVFWDRRAIENLRLGLYASAVVARLVDETIAEFQKLHATVGVSKLHDKEYWKPIHEAFWVGQLCYRLTPLSVNEFVLCDEQHPARPSHAKRIILRIDHKENSASGTSARRPLQELNITLNPSEFSFGQHIRTVGDEQYTRLLAEWRECMVHEANHHFHPSGHRAYVQPDENGDYEGYYASPDEYIAIAAGHAALLITRGIQPNAESVLPQLGLPNNAWTYFWKTFRDPEYVRRHPRVKYLARKYDWLLKRYHATFSAHWDETVDLAEHWASTAW